MALGTDPGAASADTRQWVCQFCTWPLGWHGWLAAGPGWVSEPSLSFSYNFV